MPFLIGYENTSRFCWSSGVKGSEEMTRSKKRINRRREADELFCRVVGRVKAPEVRIGELLSDSSDWKEHKSGELNDESWLLPLSLNQLQPAIQSITYQYGL